MKLVTYIMLCILVLSIVACRHNKVNVAEQSSHESFVTEPSAELLEEGRRFPPILNIQIIDGTSLGSLPMDPARLTCPPTSVFTAMASNYASPNDCQGYNVATSPLVTLSERQATNFISGITCPAACTRIQTTIWKAWSCGHDGDENKKGTKNLASGHAISRVKCVAP